MQRLVAVISSAAREIPRRPCSTPTPHPAAPRPGFLARQPRAGMTPAPVLVGRLASRPSFANRFAEISSPAAQDDSIHVFVGKSTRPFGNGSPPRSIFRSHKTLGTQAFRAICPLRRFPNDRSGFCQICSWLNCSALCPIPLRATMVPWKQPAHDRDSLCLLQAAAMLPRRARFLAIRAAPALRMPPNRQQVRARNDTRSPLRVIPSACGRSVSRRACHLGQHGSRGISPSALARSLD